MTDREEETATLATTGAGMTAADTMETQTTTGRGPGGRRSTAIVGATVGETTSFQTATAATITATSGGAALRGAQRLLDAPGHTPPHGLALHPQPRRPKTKLSLTLPRRDCSLPRRTRSRMRTERALCSSTTSRPRLVSPSSDGGCTFSRVTSKSVRALFSLSPPAALTLCSRRSAPYPSPKCIPHRS